jgi:hypothetical protein
MTIQIWILEEELIQLDKISNQIIDESEIFDNLVEFTPMMLMEGQICVNIDLDKYIELTDKGLLLFWEPNNIE